MPLTAAPYPRFRSHTWLDIETGKPVHGIQAQAAPRAPWRHLAIDGKPAFFKTPASRDRRLSKLEHDVAYGRIRLTAVRAARG